jgi:undecaprenyl-diphosphatase
VRLANPGVPIDPPWLPEAARDISALGSMIVLEILLLAVGLSAFDPKASRSVADAGRGSKRRVTYLTLGALLARIHSEIPARIYFMTLAALLTVLVGLSRIYLGVHYPTDVLAGWCIGTALGQGLLGAHDGFAETQQAHLHRICRPHGRRARPLCRSA